MADISQITLPDGTTYDIKDPVARAAASEGGGGGIFYGECNTSASTQTKIVDIEDFELYTGVPVLVKFSEGQTYNGQPKLNVSGTGAINIVRNGTSAGIRYQWLTGEVVLFVYNGTNWMEVNGGVASITYYGVTRLNDSTSSTSTSEAATPNAVKQAYDLANSKQNALTFDSTPTLNSTNPVTSGGVHTALTAKQNKITYSNTDLIAGTSSLTTGEFYAYYE